MSIETKYTEKTFPKIINVKIVLYRYNLDKPMQVEEYRNLCNFLKNHNFKKFASFSSCRYEDKIQLKLSDKKLSSDNCRNIESFHTIDTEYLFSNQYNTTELRIHDWQESIYPNKQIKEGYYIFPDLQYKKLLDLKNQQYICGYCGKRYINPEQEYCNCCLNSKYLKENDLHLLKLLPVSKTDIKNIRKKYSIPEKLIKDYKSAQEKQIRIDNTKKIKEIKDNLQKKIASKKREAEYKIEILEKQYSIDNFIYYSHTDKAVFGWNVSIKDNKKEIEKIKSLNLSFNYEIK